jgi:hypothetical protein
MKKPAKTSKQYKKNYAALRAEIGDAMMGLVGSAINKGISQKVFIQTMISALILVMRVADRMNKPTQKTLTKRGFIRTRDRICEATNAALLEHETYVGKRTKMPE